MKNPSASMLIIGDEILSGRTRESNMHFLAIELSKVGIDLKVVRIVKDYKPEIISAVRTLSASFDFVFTSGGLDRTGIMPLHSLRSNGITRMLANGGKLDFVMKIAGHVNPQTTLNHYVRSENFDLQDTVNLLSN